MVLRLTRKLADKLKIKSLSKYDNKVSAFDEWYGHLTCPQKRDPIIKLGSKEKKIWAKSDSQASRSSVNSARNKKNFHRN